RRVAGDLDDATAGAFAQGADTGDRPGLAELVDIAVVGQDVAGGVAARRAVVDAPGFDRLADIVLCHRGVVGALQGDGEGGDAGGTRQVADGVGEDFLQGVAGKAQGLYLGVVVVDDVGGTAGGGNDQH